MTSKWPQNGLKIVQMGYSSNHSLYRQILISEKSNYQKFLDQPEVQTPFNIFENISKENLGKKILGIKRYKATRPQKLTPVTK